MKRTTLEAARGGEYELLDCGGEEKLEKYSNVVLSRPDPQALWQKSLGEAEWAKADGRYERQKGEGSLPAGRQGKWITSPSLPKEWPIKFGGFTFVIRPTSFKHTGLFPEQQQNWKWIGETLKLKAKSPTKGEMNGSPTPFVGDSAQKPKVLNLFAYTGGASLAAAAAGAEVVHVDASKTAVAWARENATASGLADAPIRWLVEDVLVFVEREIKRGNKYDLILMDPPAFGHGPKDELWKIEEHLLELFKLCGELLSEKPIGILVNGYAAGYSPLALAYNLEPFAKKYGGEVEYGDLTIPTKAGDKLLPAGIFARWCTG